MKVTFRFPNRSTESVALAELPRRGDHISIAKDGSRFEVVEVVWPLQFGRPKFAMDEPSVEISLRQITPPSARIIPIRKFVLEDEF